MSQAMNMATYIDILVSKIKQPQFYVPRDYKTIGGMWTVDTWKRGDVMVMVMDEGYTTRIVGPGFEASVRWNEFERKDVIKFHQGNDEIVSQAIGLFE